MKTIADPLHPEREYVEGGWLEPVGVGRWRICGNYMYGDGIEGIPTRRLAIEILEALEDTAASVRDACYGS